MPRAARAIRLGTSASRRAHIYETIGAASCPVPACEPYCRFFSQIPGTTGSCNDQTHMCDCAMPPSAALVNKLPGPGATGVAVTSPPSHFCLGLRCVDMHRAWQCIPNNTLDGCTQQIINDTHCGPLMPTCDTICGTVRGASECVNRLFKCSCDIYGFATPPPPPPKKSGAAVHLTPASWAMLALGLGVGVAVVLISVIVAKRVCGQAAVRDV